MCTFMMMIIKRIPYIRTYDAMTVRINRILMEVEDFKINWNFK